VAPLAVKGKVDPVRAFRSAPSRSVQTTLAPSAASWVAMAAPVPEPAPVTMATRSSNLLMASPARTAADAGYVRPQPSVNAPAPSPPSARITHPILVSTQA
jgi:hypothetical protein